MLNDAQLEELLKELPDRAARSGLEPYRELILEMRRRKFSYRQIAKLLDERCGFEISHSAVHDFVRKHGATPHQLKSGASAEPSSAPGRRGTDASMRDRIAALKREKPTPLVEDAGFRFDPAKPLHLEDEPP